MGVGTPAARTPRTISGTAAAAFSLFTVTRTICDPAAASDNTCAVVEATSAVSVFVIDCTTTGKAEPTGTMPIHVVGVERRAAKAVIAWKDTRDASGCDW